MRSAVIAGWLIAALLLALLAGLICARAALGRTHSWSFPIDDAYIYSNYVLSAAQGHWFEYNPGERSGGVTGVGWLVLLRLIYPLTAPLNGTLAGWAPQSVQAAAPSLAGVAGRLYASTYAAGAVLFAVAGAATSWLAYLVYSPLSEPAAGNDRRIDGAVAGVPAAGTIGAVPPVGRYARLPTLMPPGVAGFAALLAGLLVLADRQLIWGSFSGLELPLSLALVPLALATLLADARRGRLRWSLAVAVVLPWARPELFVFALVGTLWLLLPIVPFPPARRLRLAALYLSAALLGFACLALLLLSATGRPLPSSFYAKVGGLRLDRVLGGFQEWLAAHQWQPFALLAAAALGAVLLLAAGRRKSSLAPGGAAALLVVASAATFLVAMALALPWFGQQDRYVLPLHPLALLLAVGIIPATARLLRLRAAPLRQNRLKLLAAALLFVLLLLHLADLRVWSTSLYALDIQNIEDAQVTPALWFAVHTPPDSVLAAEPIGAIRLFSQRRTVDIVGLTTPAALGTYGDWPATANILRREGAQYLLYYPRLWPDGKSLPWAHELQRFNVPDNDIAGDNLIAAYSLSLK